LIINVCIETRPETRPPNKIMNDRKGTILVVDDDPKLVKALSVRLQVSGYAVEVAFNGADALSVAESKKLDLIITDVWMPVGTGFSLAYRLKTAVPGIPVLFLSASKQANLKAMAEKMNAVGFLEKPYEPEVLLRTIAQILKPQSLVAMNAD
jgi:two-component system, chemotaxis family, chemotaxis protein CheY